MRFLCKIGIHDWKNLKSASCKCWLRTDHILSGSTVQNDLPAVTVLQKCKHCSEKNAYITEGTVVINLNLDYVRAQPIFSEFFKEVGSGYMSTVTTASGQRECDCKDKKWVDLVFTGDMELDMQSVIERVNETTKHLEKQ